MKLTVPGFLLIALPVFAMISSCAKVSSPAGGPRDREPPVVVKSNPPGGTVNFRGKSIAVTFNEFVVLDRINDKFMVSPPMNTMPRIYIRRKNIIIDLEEELKDSTTYTFYFQDAVRDLNEGNPINNFQFVLSTGPVIDSLSVTGRVYNAFNLEVPENTLVLLYGHLEDTAVVKQLPDYITRLEPNGAFRIDNVRGGAYRLYALKDIDNTKNYNLPDEEFAFCDTIIDITPERHYLPRKEEPAPVTPGTDKNAVIPEAEGEYTLILFQAEKTQRYLTSSARQLPYKLVYTLSLPPDTMNFEFSVPDTDREKYLIETSRNRDTVTVWLTDSTLYNQPLLNTVVSYPFTDSTGTNDYRRDTIQMRFLQPRAARVKPARTPFRVSTGIVSGQLKPGAPLTLKSETPFRTPDTSRIRIYELSESGRKGLPYRLTRDTLTFCRYFLEADLRQGGNYLYITDSHAFGNIYGDYSDSAGVKFSLRSPESYGMLTMNVSNHTGKRIVQLLDNREMVIREIYMDQDGSAEFPLLEKGFYRVRVIYDLNGDGKWTTGDFFSGRQPEPVSYYPGEIEIPVNWRVEQEWDLELKNFKKQQLRARRTPGR